MFFCEFSENFHSSFFTEHLRTAVSVIALLFKFTEATNYILTFSSDFPQSSMYMMTFSLQILSSSREAITFIGYQHPRFSFWKQVKPSIYAQAYSMTYGLWGKCINLAAYFWTMLFIAKLLARDAGENESGHAEYVLIKTRTDPRKFSVTRTIIA